MTTDPKVSLVMPVYNGEDYIREAIDSILTQTLQDFELICVDDGSTDGTSSILDTYKAEDERIRVVRQENAGVSAARNMGLANAQGKYVLFCDDDDLFDSCMLEKMVAKMDRFAADICIPNGYKLDASDDNRVMKSRFINLEFIPNQDCFTPEEAGKYLLNFPTFYIYKMYRRAFLEENGILFGAQRAEEDALFFTKALLLAQRITVLKDRVFYYRINTGTSVSDFIFENDILAGYESMLLVKGIMQRSGMYDDPDFHQSFVNRALTKTMNYRGRTKDFASLKTLFDKLVLDEGLLEMDLLGHDADYFYNESHYRELMVMANCSNADEYLFYLYDTSRNALRMAKREVGDLKREVKRMKKRSDATRDLQQVEAMDRTGGEGTFFVRAARMAKGLMRRLRG